MSESTFTFADKCRGPEQPPLPDAMRISEAESHRACSARLLRSLIAEKIRQIAGAFSAHGLPSPFVPGREWFMPGYYDWRSGDYVHPIRRAAP